MRVPPGDIHPSRPGAGARAAGGDGPRGAGDDPIVSRRAGVHLRDNPWNAGVNAARMRPCTAATSSRTFFSVTASVPLHALRRAHLADPRRREGARHPRRRRSPRGDGGLRRGRGLAPYGHTGVAAVTAGPGVTNTITAVKNAQLAQSPLILLGGATATLLRGRGALQDIDQMALITPHVKLAIAVKKVRDLAPALDRAFRVAQEGVPGPVFIECPVDLLYDEKTVREMSGAKAMGATKGPQDVALQLVIRAHLARTFLGASRVRYAHARPAARRPSRARSEIDARGGPTAEAKRPVILLGSQATLGGPMRARRVAEAIEQPRRLRPTSRAWRAASSGKGTPLFFRHQPGEGAQGGGPRHPRGRAVRLPAELRPLDHAKGARRARSTAASTTRR